MNPVIVPFDTKASDATIKMANTLERMENIMSRFEKASRRSTLVIYVFTGVQIILTIISFIKGIK